MNSFSESFKDALERRIAANTRPGIDKSRIRDVYTQAVAGSAEWMTVGGARALVGDDGTIMAGCPGLEGEDVDDLRDEDEESRDRREAKQEAAEAAGWTGKKEQNNRADWEHVKSQAGNVGAAGSIILLRVGDAYHTFDEDARKVRETLGIGDGETTEFEGNLDAYLSRLVKAGHRVAVVERTEEGTPRATSHANPDPETQQAATQPTAAAGQQKRNDGSIQTNRRGDPIVIDGEPLRHNDWLIFKDGTPFKVGAAWEELARGRGENFAQISPSYETRGTHGMVPSEIASGEVRRPTPEELARLDASPRDARAEAAAKQRATLPPEPQAPPADPEDARKPGESFKDHVARRRAAEEAKRVAALQKIDPEKLIEMRDAAATQRTEASKTGQMTVGFDQQIKRINDELRRRNYREPSEEDKGRQAAADNFNKVSADPPAASEHDLRRASSYLEGRMRSNDYRVEKGAMTPEQRDNQNAALKTEQDWYERLWRERQRAREAAAGAPQQTQQKPAQPTPPPPASLESSPPSTASRTPEPAKVPTWDDPGQVTRDGHPFEVAKQYNTWFYRKPGTESWVAAGDKTIEFIESELGIDTPPKPTPPKTPPNASLDEPPPVAASPDPATMATPPAKPKKEPKPRKPNRFHDAAVSWIGDDDAETLKGFKQLAMEVHKRKAEEAEDNNAALKELLGSFSGVGKTDSLGRSRGVGDFIRTIVQAEDHDKIPVFDEITEMARNRYPELLSWDTGESTGAGDYEGALFARIKQGIVKPPARWSDDVMQEAYDIVQAMESGSSDNLPDTGDGYWPEDDESDDDGDWTPFTRYSAGFWTVARYAAAAAAAASKQAIGPEKYAAQRRTRTNAKVLRAYASAIRGGN